MIVRLAFLGGILSLLFSLFSFHLLDNGWWGASSAGPIEETGKIFAMLAVARTAQYRYKLNGLLIGAAVGVGFSAFETAGYVLRTYTAGSVVGTAEVLSSLEPEVALAVGMHKGAKAMEDVLVVRGLLSPLGHIVWSSIAGFAMWRTIRGRKFHWRMLVDEDFIRLLLIPVILHMLWNAPFELPFFGKYLILGIAGWFICFSLIQEGLKELKLEQNEERKKRGMVASALEN